MKCNFFLLAAAALALTACGNGPELTKSGLDKANFVTEIGGKTTSLYTISNEAGMEVCITDFGARIVSIMAPDKDDELIDVALGFDNVEAYLAQDDMGSTVGRYANRINKGKFTLDGVEHQLACNEKIHHLHGGNIAWMDRVYDVEEADASHIKFSIDSPDGEECFPGHVKAFVTYTLTEDNAVDIQYEATTDAPTIINMTNHSYFNLSGMPENTILDHTLWLNASKFTPTDNTFMTTGDILPVAGTPMDFTEPKTIGRDIEMREFEQLENANGYDHNWVLDNGGNIEEKVAELKCESTGIVLDVYTTEPGIQVYTANFLKGNLIGKNGQKYVFRAGVCLETQHYPDSPNKPDWPSTVLRPGEKYNSRTIYKFSVEK